MTAGAMQADREKVFAARMDDYISKPVAVNRLADVLTRWVRGEGESRDALGEEGGQSTAEEPLDHARLAELRSLQRAGEPDSPPR